VLVSRPIRRLKVRGSMRIEATRRPPRRMRLDVPPAGAEPAVPAGVFSRPHPTEMRTMARKSPMIRECLVKSCPPGQQVGRSKVYPADRGE